MATKKTTKKLTAMPQTSADAQKLARKGHDMLKSYHEVQDSEGMRKIPAKASPTKEVR